MSVSRSESSEEDGQAEVVVHLEYWTCGGDMRSFDASLQAENDDIGESDGLL
jgi:hypothetical protein